MDALVEIDAGASGAGNVTVSVTLDREAVEELGDLAKALRARDLEQAGWDVEGPIDVAGGSLQVRASKPFSSPAEAGDIFDEISGPAGPFSGFRLTRQRSFLRTNVAFAGAVDLTRGIESFSDADLAEKLGGQPLGIDAAELERRLGAKPADAFGFEVAVALPGARSVWEPRLGEREELTLRGDRYNWLNLLLALVAGLTGAAAIGLVAWPRRPRVTPHP